MLQYFGMRIKGLFNTLLQLYVVIRVFGMIYLNFETAFIFYLLKTLGEKNTRKDFKCFLPLSFLNALIYYI